MSREIRFRAWDKRQKKMFQVSPVWFEENDWYSDDFAECMNNTDCLIMQYTGLRDKKRTKEYPEGQEIYEGDWCKAPHDFGPGGWKVRTFEVRFNVYDGYGWNYWDMDKCEIIGNIYDNPELIKHE